MDYPDDALSQESTGDLDPVPELRDALAAINAWWESGNFSRKPELWQQMRSALAKYHVRYSVLAGSREND